MQIVVICASIKKLMIKQKTTNILKMTKLRFTPLVVSLIFFAGLAVPIYVYADTFDEQISKLRNDNDNKKEQVNSLAVEAGNIQETIVKLQQQIDGLQSQIVKNNAKNEQLAKEIKAAQIELEKQKNLLGQNIKAMYLEGKITPLEMLASSKDLSEFVDKEQYRDAVKSKIKSSLDKVTELKATLKSQKEDVEKLLREQESLKKQIGSQQTQQNRLLGLNQSEQNKVNSDIEANKEKINDLRQQQIIENLKIFGGGVQPGIAGGGGYPWGNAYCVYTNQVGGPCFNYDWYFNGSAWDSWGYGFRNCTSWVAFKLAASGKVGFTYLGNAANWPSNAAARGIPVTYGSGAQVGNAAVNPNGYYGHVMYVEAITPDGKVVVSDYNRTGDGYYRGPDSGSAAVLDQSGLVFIHF